MGNMGEGGGPAPGRGGWLSAGPGSGPSAGRGGTALGARLRVVAGTCLAAEDDLFSVIPILGEPLGQRALDDWVDQAVDLLRALSETATELELRLIVAGAGEPVEDEGPTESAEDADLTTGLPGLRAGVGPAARPARPARPAFDERLPE